MEADIKFCQDNGKKVLLSLGGATPEYGLNSYEEGESLADELWYTFGGGSDTNTFRPFGDASVDGFDLDIENGAKAGYPAFVNRMREHYAKETSKEYYIAAAPQCPFPDFFLGETLDSSWFDFIMIQFYNNYCNVINGEQFNYDIWDKWAKTSSVNKDVRLFVGVPGSPSAAGRGYVPFDKLVDTVKSLQELESFGGIMIWDVSQAYGNTLDVSPSYAHGVARLIHGDKKEDDDLPMLSSSAPSLVISPASSSTDQAVLASATDATNENNTPKGTTTAINTGKEDAPSSNIDTNIPNNSVYGLTENQVMGNVQMDIG
ncbi:hypothetical protein G6F57_005426 [Rhizopus arrhizus]|uniref:chitinase n=1 Tax=Rhizopus oryzae TaxID=64495 RepID=A0A9P6XBU3_RHIOR|nr:hypothetical protein G6F23_008150 [Rhizopus arrhizus]KAG1411105.1 hypothetical protein G6F58_008742 [Rhizopus delemar]KAG0764434.1 hypothetical protein G6F24_005222 [Rhizopus arrhizus]KAG0791407.1 hypothetical protein G6F21_005107 [Rhizopus arrhizus]KAG0792711.1 hypothetical protein G6F22_005791 [Rhizopus arrhizus]